MSVSKDQWEAIRKWRAVIGPDRQEVRDGVPGARERAFSAFVSKRNRYNGLRNLGVTLKDWITIHDGADWARKQCHEYYDEVMAERKRGKE